MMNFHMLATCPEETKEIVMKEIADFGGQDIKPLYKAVSFTTDEVGFYNAHLNLSTISNFYLILKEVRISNQIEAVFSQSSRIPWPDIFRANKTFRVDATIGDRGEHEITANLLSRKVKEGLWDAFKFKEGKMPLVNIPEPDVVVIAHLRGGLLTLGVHTSGKALHKRGYRSVEGHPAPLKETLAASILRFAGYTGEQPLYDPMCGSGTIAIEAAYISLGKAPLIHRKKGEFAFESLKFFKRSLFEECQSLARQQKVAELRAPIFASDISPLYIDYAKSTALRARVEKYIQFFAADFLASPPPAPRGIMVCNLPYGERLAKENPEELENLYQNIGSHLKHNYKGWTAAFLVAENSPYKLIGLRPKKKLKLLNGSIPAKLLIFELFTGSLREHKQISASG